MNKILTKSLGMVLLAVTISAVSACSTILQKDSVKPEVKSSETDVRTATTTTVAQIVTTTVVSASTVVATAVVVTANMDKIINSEITKEYDYNLYASGKVEVKVAKKEGVTKNIPSIFLFQQIKNFDKVKKVVEIDQFYINPRNDSGLYNVLIFVMQDGTIEAMDFDTYSEKGVPILTGKVPGINSAIDISFKKDEKSIGSAVYAVLKDGKEVEIYSSLINMMNK